MIPLPDTYKKNGYDYELLERKGDVAIFSQKSDGKIIAYEVFEVMKQKEWTAFGKTYPAKEAIPGTEIWGTSAFSPSTLNGAYERMKELLEKIKSRQVKQVDAKIQRGAPSVAEI